jgi:UDP-N-acetylglucosamine--N-acetylmuramyl-(pentapeptide) pyrophosphoryl-undecaprenol N-acetylglucosamine transferase
VPFPLAAEDHQTVNAQMLVKEGAALMVADKDAELKLIDTVIELIGDETKCKSFGVEATKLGIKNADQLIAELMIKKMNEINA